MNMLRAWWAECKLYVFGFLLIVGVAYHFYYGHEQRKAGKAEGDQEIAALKGQYAQAYDDTVRQAQKAQREADAKALKDAKDRAAKAEAQIADLAARKHTAEQSAATFQKRLNEARKHDATAAALLDTPLPASVRAAGQG